MSIKEILEYIKGRGFIGGAYIGICSETSNENDNVTLTTNVLVFMAVGINVSFKIPLAYFLIKSLTGAERANILNTALRLLHNANVKCNSITFDGAYVNSKMCTVLGADFTYGDGFKPYTLHPVTLESFFIFFDDVHMLKLIRNCLWDKEDKEQTRSTSQRTKHS